MSTLPLPDTQPQTVRCRGVRRSGRVCGLVLLREPWRSLGMGEDCAERAGLVVPRRHRLRGPSSEAVEATLFEINEGGAVGALRYRHKPAEILAMEWTGNNEDELITFTGGEFEALEECDDDPAATAAVRESTHGTWRLLYTGDYVIKADGFLDRIPADQLAADYDLVPADAA